MADGTWYFHLRTVDNAGNWASTVHLGPFNIDTAAPNTTITSGPSGDIDTNSVTFEFTGTDNNGPSSLTYSYRLDSGSWSTYSSSTSASYTGLATGSHTFEVKAKDAAGNEDGTSDSRSFNVLPPWNGPGVYTSRVSVDSLGNEANGDNSDNSSISSNGRYITFSSNASNLISGDNNNMSDVFRKNLQTGQIIRVSVNSVENEANAGSYSPSISADGRYIVFSSNASNLVSGDTNGQRDIFKKDLSTGEIVRVSTDSSGGEANNESWRPSISPDGRYVAFDSFASNLVPGDTNSTWDIFRKDMQTGEIARVSTDSSGIQSAVGSTNSSISSGGRFVTFTSGSSSLVLGDINNVDDIFRKDLQTGAVVLVSTDFSGNQANDYSQLSSISSDGRYVVFITSASNLVSGDTNNATDIFRKDLQAGEIVRVSTNFSGEEANSNYFYHRDSGYPTGYPTISADGRYVVFESDASNLVSDDINNADDIFRKDVQTGEIVRVSVNSQGSQTNNLTSARPSISADARYVAFYSDASNLVPGDTNSTTDVFIADMSLYPDVVPPNTTITSGPSGDIDTNSVTFEFTGTDNNGPSSLTYSYRLDSGSWSTYSSSTSASYTGLARGSHTFEVKAKDAAGNEDGSPDSRSFYVRVVQSPDANSLTGKPLVSPVRLGKV